MHALPLHRAALQRAVHPAAEAGRRLSLCTDSNLLLQQSSSCTTVSRTVKDMNRYWLPLLCPSLGHRFTLAPPVPPVHFQLLQQDSANNRSKSSFKYLPILSLEKLVSMDDNAPHTFHRLVLTKLQSYFQTSRSLQSRQPAYQTPINQYLFVLQLGRDNHVFLLFLKFNLTFATSKRHIGVQLRTVAYWTAHCRGCPSPLSGQSPPLPETYI